MEGLYIDLEFSGCAFTLESRKPVVVTSLSGCTCGQEVSYYPYKVLSHLNRALFGERLSKARPISSLAFREESFLGKARYILEIYHPFRSVSCCLSCESSQITKIRKG